MCAKRKMKNLYPNHMRPLFTHVEAMTLTFVHWFVAAAVVVVVVITATVVVALLLPFLLYGVCNYLLLSTYLTWIFHVSWCVRIAQW